MNTWARRTLGTAGRLAALALAPALIAAVGASPGSAKSPPQPPTLTLRMEVDLRGYGLEPVAWEKNSYYSRLPIESVGKVFSESDTVTKLLPLGENVAVVYHTNPRNYAPNWPHNLDAWFVDLSNGALVHYQVWNTRPSTNVEPEARMLALAHGRFVVVAHDTLSAYSGAFEFEAQYPLPRTQTATNPWEARTIAGGTMIFLSRLRGGEFLWLNGETMEPIRHATASQFPGLDAGKALNATDKLLVQDYTVFDFDGGRRQYSDPSLWIPSPFSVQLSSKFVLTYPCLLGGGSNDGVIRVISMADGTHWSKRAVEPTRTSFMKVRPSLSGNRFAALIAGGKFDGVKAGKGGLVYAYDVTGQLLGTAPLKNINGDYSIELSPEGTKLLMFDGQSLYVYDLPQQAPK